MEESKRVLIIGLDGFTWRIGRKLAREGHMPCLSKLMEMGCHGTLKSVLPYETSPAWSSFQTGCYPNKTGIFAFHGYSRKTRQIRLNSFREIRVPTIWELLNDAGKKIISINMPMTSPPPLVNGIIIPGLTCPKLSKETVHPPVIYHKYLKSRPDYLIVNNKPQACLSDYISKAISTEKVRGALALELMKEPDWDLFSIQIQSTDAFQHKNWWALDPDAEGYTETDYGQAIEFYKNIDSLLKQLVDVAGESVLTVIASDHGFCSKKAEIGINTWLSQNGYLIYHSSKKDPSTKVAKERLKAKFPILKLLAKYYGHGKERLTAFRKTDRFAELYAEKVVRHIREIIDIDRSLAFCLGGMSGSLYITDRTRENQVEAMIGKLLAEYGPCSSEPVITSIEPIKELSAHSETDSFSPDYMIHLMPGVEARINPEDEMVVKSGIVNGKQTGTHEQDGMFVLNGPQVKSGSMLNSEIVSIAPTILAYLGVSVPDHMDGNVLLGAFKDSMNVEYKKSVDFEKDDSGYSNDDQSAVEKQLEDLGYL